jgi:hypothetical protein
MGRGQVVLTGGGLMGGELADCCEEEFQCPCIEEQGPNYLLHPCLFCGETGVEGVVIDGGERCRDRSV